MIYLVILNDNPREVQTAWSTRQLAEDEIKRQLDNTLHFSEYYWLLNRLDVKALEVDTTYEEI